jgi:hypothetical protein
MEFNFKPLNFLKDHIWSIILVLIIATATFFLGQFEREDRVFRVKTEKKIQQLEKRNELLEQELKSVQGDINLILYYLYAEEDSIQ